MSAFGLFDCLFTATSITVEERPINQTPCLPIDVNQELFIIVSFIGVDIENYPIFLLQVFIGKFNQHLEIGNTLKALKLVNSSKYVWKLFLLRYTTNDLPGMLMRYSTHIYVCKNE